MKRFSRLLRALRPTRHRSRGMVRTLDSTKLAEGVMDLLQGASSRIDLIGTSLLRNFDAPLDALVAAGQRGVRVRIIAPDPDEEARGVAPVLGGPREAWKTRAVVEALRATRSPAIEIRMHVNASALAYARIDDAILVEPASAYPSRPGPAFVIRADSGGAFDAFRDNFDALWAVARDIQSDPDWEAVRRAAREAGKGASAEAVESLAAQAFSSIPMFDVKAEGAAGDLGIDLVVWNSATRGEGRELGTPIVVQIKSSRHPLSAHSVRRSLAEARDFGARTTVLFVSPGLTSDALSLLEDSTFEGESHVVVMTPDDVAAAQSPYEFAQRLAERSPGSRAYGE